MKTPIDVVLNGRTYRVRFYQDGTVMGVFVCNVRTRERGQPKGAWNLQGERRLPKYGPTANAVIQALP